MASPADEAARLRRSAVADIAGGRARRAVQSLTQAINLVSVRCDLPPDEAQQRQRVHHACLLTLAVARLTLDGVAAAHKELEAAHLLTGDDPELAARWHAQHGLILGRSGDLVAAAAELEEATRSLDVFTPQEQCSILINRGMVAFERARPTEAVSLFTTAAEVATEAGLDRQRFMALHNAGYAAYLTGDLPGALARLAAADAIDADVVRAPALFDRGRILHEAGLLDEALEVLTGAAIACGRRGNDLLRGEILLETARVLLLVGDPAAAGRTARAAHRRFLRAGAPGWVARTAATTLTTDLVRRRRLVSLLTDAEALESTASQLGDTELLARAICLTAEATALLRDIPRGRAALARYPASDLGLAASLTRSHAVAALATAAGETAEARAELTRAAVLLADNQASSAGLESRAARAVLGASLAQQDLDLAVDTGRVSEVISSLERWSAAGRSLPWVARSHDLTMADDVQALRSVMRKLHGEPGAAETATWQHEAEILRRRLRDAAHTAARTDVSHLRSAPADDVLDQVAAAGRELWWLFARDGRLWVAGVTGGRPLLRPVSDVSAVRELVRRVQADLRTLPRQQQGPLRASIQASLRASLDSLAALVPTPQQPVVVVECAETAGVPWAMLPPLRDVPVTVSRAGSEWLDRRRTAHAEVTILAGPGLTHHLAELDGVTAAWGGMARTEQVPEAETAAAVAALQGQELVHLAAHGRHRHDSPLFSSLQLTDGELFAHELQQGRVTAGHVVLSACDVGSVTVRPGGGTLGFAGALVSLGAASVVAAVAPVPDEAAAALMVKHHQGLASGLESDDALARASAAVPEAAMFILTGSTWRVRTTPVT